MSLFIQHKLFIALVTSTVALVGCGDASSGADANNSSPTEITTENTSKQIQSISSNVANCNSTASASAALSAVKTSHIRDLIQTSKILSQSTGQSKIVIQPSTASNGCSASPGSVVVDDPSHEHGNTDFKLTFNAYCLTGDRGNTIVTGVVNATENGTPSDHGPVVDALDMSAKELQVNYTDDNGANQTAEITLTGARTEYGKPAARSPDTPTSDQPDTIKISNLKIDVTTTGDVHQIQNLSLKRHGGNSATVQIDSGTYRSPEGDVVSLSTPVSEPLQLTINQGDLTSGTIVMTGANDTRAEISATNSDRVVAVEVNGSPLKQLDCSDADDTISDFISILVRDLPVH